MPRFLVKWEMNSCAFPIDPEQQGKIIASLLQMVKEDEKAGVGLNWGMYPEANKGISFSDQNEEELATTLMKYSPYIFFRVKPLLSLDQAMRAFKKAIEVKKK